ncbi:hypothetical protein BC831DRAFT_453983 [Entophlyctis helioformis]|nr:hypothetical protein BC831DRAFT_453983 [Entophlyctis helioformis]
MRKHFSHHIKTADTSILPNENSIDLPTPLIPEMEQPFLTVKERLFLALRSAILNKPLWWTKFTDATIAAKWREEAVAQRVSQPCERRCGDCHAWSSQVHDRVRRCRARVAARHSHPPKGLASRVGRQGA